MLFENIVLGLIDTISSNLCNYYLLLSIIDLFRIQIISCFMFIILVEIVEILSLISKVRIFLEQRHQLFPLLPLWQQQVLSSNLQLDVLVSFRSLNGTNSSSKSYFNISRKSLQNSSLPIFGMDCNCLKI